jgi:tripartite-type tricarboxylate transporter receptor subunit TctC
MNEGRKRQTLRTAMMLTSLILLSWTSMLSAQPSTWPSQPIRVIVPFPAGSGNTEMLVRLVAPEITKSLGQQVIVENRPGAGTVIGVNLAARSTDGHTFVAVANSFTVNHTLVKDLPYDTLKDFQPVVLMARTPNVLAAHPSVAPNTLGELIAYAKKNPGKLSYGSFGNGTTAHFAGEMLKMMAGIDMVHVPYKGGAPALLDLLAGNIDVMFGNLPQLLPHIRAGKLKAYGTTFLHRVPQAPDIPTIAEQGYPTFETDSWFGILAPAAMSKEAVAGINAAFNRALSGPGHRDALAKLGLEPIGGTPERFAEHIRKEISKYAHIVQVANIRID